MARSASGRAPPTRAGWRPRSAVSRQPEVARLGAWLGAVDLAAQRPADALAFLERALGAGNRELSTFTDRAAALEALGRRADAAAAWTDVAARAGDSPLALRARSRAARLGSDASGAGPEGPESRPACPPAGEIGGELGAARLVRRLTDQLAGADVPVLSEPRRSARPPPDFSISGAVPDSVRSRPVPSAAAKAPSSFPASAPSPFMQAFITQPAGRAAAEQTTPSRAAQPVALPPGVRARENSAATNDGTSAGSPRGTSANGPNAARATVPSRSVKPWLPITSASSLTVADVKAFKTGRPRMPASPAPARHARTRRP